MTTVTMLEDAAIRNAVSLAAAARLLREAIIKERETAQWPRNHYRGTTTG